MDADKVDVRKRNGTADPGLPGKLAVKTTWCACSDVVSLEQAAVCGIYGVIPGATSAAAVAAAEC